MPPINQPKPTGNVPKPPQGGSVATKFQRSAQAVSAKPDKRGRVAIRILLVDERVKNQLTHTAGNRREDIFLEDVTVGEVHEAISQALFPSEE